VSENVSSSVTTSSRIIANDVDQIVIFSDAHGHRQALAALEQSLAALNGTYHVVCNGDIIYGGISPVESIQWVMQHAADTTTCGNHDEAGFTFGYEGEPQPAYTEVGALQRMSDAERDYLRSLPQRLELTWRDRRIVCMHGHRSVEGKDCSWLSSPDAQIACFAESAADLVALGHTHFAYIHQGDDCIVANSGSIGSPILAVAFPSNFHVQSGGGAVVAGDNLRSSYLLIREADGKLQPEIVRFDYDRTAVLDEMEAAGHDGLDVHRGWLLEGIIRV
jgi:putative phosphoesterase